MKETWKTLERCPKYTVSNLGKVKRIAPSNSANPLSRVGHTLANVIDGNGYPTVLLYPGDGSRKQVCVHILVCETFNGPRPGEGWQVAHGDGNPTNNRSDNLRWASAEENAADRVKHGRQLRGDKHPFRARPELIARGEATNKTPLTADDVIAIRASGQSHAALARVYGITAEGIASIRKRRTWKHIE